MTVLNDESRKKLSASLKAKWASGTRKPSPRSAYEKSSATMKQMIADGRFSMPVNSSEQCSANRAKADNEKIAAQLRKMNKARKGQLMPPGPSARGVGHWKARYWEVLSPDRRVFGFTNLNEFIRTHPDLFDPADLIWKGSQCRASKGMTQLFQTKRAPLSWKGWRALKKDDQHPHLIVRGAVSGSQTE